MPRTIAFAVSLAALLTLPVPAAAETEVEQLRAEFEQKLRALQESYESRLKALERRDSPATPAPAARSSSSSFNPDVSLILQGRYARRKDVEEPGITGFTAAGHEHGSKRGFTLDHSELVASGNIDPYFRGYAALALADGEIEVEEAWFQTLRLGHGFSLKGGRFLSGVGYANEQHSHAWDFADQSLMYRSLFGEHLVQDGAQLRWIAPTEAFLEFGVELARGQVFPGSEAGGNRNGAGAWAAFAKVGADLGESHSWRAGVNFVAARPREREGHFEDLNDVETHTAFDGRSTAWIADFVWKWAPEGNARERNFKFQAEYFRRREEGDLSCEDNTGEGGACAGLADAYRSRQSGWYAQGVYQFMPRWRAGYRYDRLDSGSVAFGALPIAAEPYRPTRHSVMLDFSPSEFSRFRVQLARDRSMRDVTDRQIILQYVHSLGAHGAHRF